LLQHFHKRIHGWFEKDGEAIYSAAVNYFPDRANFIEVGTWKGKSAAYMGVEIANSGKSIALWTIDHFQGSDEMVHRDDDALRSGMLETECRRNLESVASWVQVVKQTSTVAASQIEDSSVDFIFLDGAHDYASVLADIRAWLPKLKPDGVIGGDDIGWAGVRRAVTEVFGVSPESDPPQVWHKVGRCWLVVPSLEAAQAFGLAPLSPTSTVAIHSGEAAE